MVSTSAFGLGVDIPNIRCVVHYTLPFDLNDYYQQFGRDGRDGQPATAHLLYDPLEGTSLIDWINRKTLETETDQHIKQLRVETLASEKQALLGYLETADKWQYILDYFGEERRGGRGWRWWWVVVGVWAMLWVILLLS